MRNKKIVISTLGICIAFLLSVTMTKAETTSNSTNSSSSTSGITIPSDTGLPDSQTGIKPILEKILVWMLGIFGVIALISFAISGLQYLTSAGSDTRMESAKRNMVYAIIGVVVALSAVVVIQAVDAALRGSSTF